MSFNRKHSLKTKLIISKKAIGNQRWLGKKHKQSSKLRIGLANSGKLNGMWRGAKVGYGSLHDWVKTKLIKPLFCSCGNKKNIELCNISQKYKRNLLDWEWLCRRCHMEKDGRLLNLIRRNKRC